VSQEEKAKEKIIAETFSEMIRTFGDAISEVFDDPKLKEKAKEFVESAAESAQIFRSRFKDEEVKARFREAGRAAQDFGKGITDYFKFSNETKEE